MRHKAWVLLGRLLFILSWPILGRYLARTKRTRVIATSGSKVLVVRTWLSTGLWILPGGGLHKDEPPAKGATRELREETGVNLPPDALSSIGTVEHSKRGITFHDEFFTVELAEQSRPKPRVVGREVLVAEWVELSGLTASNCAEDVLVGLAAIRK